MRLFLRTGKYKWTAESASQPITVRHFAGSDACHMIIDVISVGESQISSIYVIPVPMASTRIRIRCILHSLRFRRKRVDSGFVSVVLGFFGTPCTVYCDFN
jgi:hypothetical protein